MNTLLRCCIATAALALLAACAHQGTMRHQSAAVPAATHQPDGQYIHAVETKARVRGVEVHWVNPPVKRMVAAADNATSD